MLLEIGGGTLLTPGWVNLDYIHGVGEWKRKAEDIPWPAEDNSIEGLRASHVLEHIPAGNDRINVMNEAWRVLRPGGLFEIIVPCVQVNGKMTAWQAWADPTHLSYFCYPESFHYFDGSFAANADYGIKIWNNISMEIQNGWEARVLFGKPV